jgi:hypothetical protein
MEHYYPGIAIALHDSGAALEQIQIVADRLSDKDNLFDRFHFLQVAIRGDDL